MRFIVTVVKNGEIISNSTGWAKNVEEMHKACATLAEVNGADYDTFCTLA